MFSFLLSFFSSKNICALYSFLLQKKYSRLIQNTNLLISRAPQPPVNLRQIKFLKVVNTAAMTDARHYQSEYLVCLDEINYHFQTKFGNQRVGCLQQLSCYCIGTNQGGLELRCYQAILEHVTLLVQKIVLVFFRLYVADFKLFSYDPNEFL